MCRSTCRCQTKRRDSQSSKSKSVDSVALAEPPLDQTMLVALRRNTSESHRTCIEGQFIVLNHSHCPCLKSWTWVPARGKRMPRGQHIITYEPAEEAHRRATQRFPIVLNQSHRSSPKLRVRARSMKRYDHSLGRSKSGPQTKRKSNASRLFVLKHSHRPSPNLRLVARGSGKHKEW